MEFFGINNLWLFLVSSILIILSPGIDTMLVLNKSLTGGRKIGSYTTLGIGTGILFHTLLGVLGLSILLAKAAYLFTLLKMIGAIYLVCLGVKKLIKKSKATHKVAQVKIVESNKKSFLTGVITNIFNPKVALFFLAFFPQFITPDSGLVSKAFLTMGLIFIGLTIIWLLTVNYLVAYFSKILLTSPRAIKIIDKISGLMFLAMGVKLALSSRE